jgi:hypothetical protein
MESAPEMESGQTAEGSSDGRAGAETFTIPRGPMKPASPEDPGALAGELLDRVAAAERDDLRDLIRTFDLARDAALLRLLDPTAGRLLTPQDAAELVALPERRLRSLSRGKSWALRFGNTLRIDEAGLLAWARCSRHARNRTEQASGAGPDVQGVHESARAPHSRRLRTMKG